MMRKQLELVVPKSITFLGSGVKTRVSGNSKFFRPYLKVDTMPEYYPAIAIGYPVRKTGNAAHR